jgi:hypothetical protein
MNKAQTTRNVEFYQIKRNSKGDLLFVFPAGNSVNTIDQFDLRGDDLILTDIRGLQTKLMELPDSLLSRIREVESIRIVELRDKRPVGEHTARNACK